MPRAADHDTAQLFAAKPSDFVRARNALLARLRTSGRDAEAAEIQRLRKPSPALWAVNQLAHQVPGDLADFVKAVERLQGAQMGARQDLAEAKAGQRRALDDLLERTGALLREAGLPSSPAVLGRVSATLLGTAVDLHGRAALRQGRLTRELAAPGFEAFALKGVPRGSRASPRARTDHPGRAAALRARRQAERDARTAERRAARLERQAAQRQRVATKTADVVAGLREQLRRAEQRLVEDRQAAAEASRFAARAREEAQRAVTKLTEDEAR